MFSFSTPSTTQPLFPTAAPSASPSTSFASGNAMTTIEQLSTPNSHPFQYIQQCYDPASPNYRFRFYFYNYVPPATTVATMPTCTEPLQQPTKPANVGDKMWAQIQTDNPDPNKYIPVMANGFEALRERASWQSQQFQLQTQKIRVRSIIFYCVLFCRNCKTRLDKLFKSWIWTEQACSLTCANAKSPLPVDSLKSCMFSTR